MKRLAVACVLAFGAWWLHREWWQRFAPIPPFVEPFDEPGGGFDWPWQPTTGNPFPSGTALTTWAGIEEASW